MSQDLPIHTLGVFSSDFSSHLFPIGYPMTLPLPILPIALLGLDFPTLLGLSKSSTTLLTLFHLGWWHSNLALCPKLISLLTYLEGGRTKMCHEPSKFHLSKIQLINLLLWFTPLLTASLSSPSPGSSMWKSSSNQIPVIPPLQHLPSIIPIPPPFPLFWFLSATGRGKWIFSRMTVFPSTP